jgi:hypothetical protein
VVGNGQQDCRYDIMTLIDDHLADNVQTDICTYLRMNSCDEVSCAQVG